MVAEFVNCYGMSLPEVYAMPAQMFFIYYKYIPSVTAINIIHNVQALNMAKAQQYADVKNKHKVERAFKKLERLAGGK